MNERIILVVMLCFVGVVTLGVLAFGFVALMSDRPSSVPYNCAPVTEGRND